LIALVGFSGCTKSDDVPQGTTEAIDVVVPEREQSPADESSPLAGQPAPGVEGSLLDGSRFSLKDQFPKHVVLLDFWATWCGPCLEELPVLMKLAEEYQNQGVVLYAVNQEEDAEHIREFLKGKNWKLNVVLDPDGKHGNAYDLQAIPQLVIIGRDGKVRRVHVGYSPEIEQVLRKELDAILAAS
jgi:thiol-disulfide isomerase/thioredoxin